MQPKRRLLLRDRRAVAAIALLIPLLVGASAVAFLAGPAVGASPLAPHSSGGGCTTTYSDTNPPPTFLTISSSGVYCFTAGQTFNTQIVVTASSVTLESTSSRGTATISPASVIADACRHGGTPAGPADSSCSGSGGYTEAAIILVSGATMVAIDNLVVDGASAATGSGLFTSSCAAPTFVGILFSGASGSITGGQATNLYQADSNYYGCQSDAGLGIYVQSPPATTSTVTIQHETVTNYQKNGITCNDSGTSCIIDSNTVSPLAAAQPHTASNGIQIGDAAVGTVTHNTISGNECGTPNCGSDYVTLYQSTGILTYGSGPGTSVQYNTVTGNDVGILLYSDTVLVKGNQVHDNRWEGIYLGDGQYTVQANHISGGLIGIAVVSDGYATNSASATLKGNNFQGTYGTSPIQLAAFSGAPNGGANAEPVVLSMDGGITQTVTSGSSSTPSFVNITTFPGGPR